MVYGSTEMGANPNLSWVGVIGYSAASSLPALIICVIGPRVREISGEKSFCSTDFGLVRYGRLMQLSIAGISVFYSKLYARSWSVILMVTSALNLAYCLHLTISVHLHGF